MPSHAHYYAAGRVSDWLALLDRVGITRFHTLPVTAFALDDNARTFLTPQYAFNLAVFGLAPAQIATMTTTGSDTGNVDDVTISTKVTQIGRAHV